MVSLLTTGEVSRRESRAPSGFGQPPNGLCFRSPPEIGLMTKRRKVIVHIGTSADGYIARPDGDLEWLTSLPAPEGFYGMDKFVQSIDTKILGRKTYEWSRQMG